MSRRSITSNNSEFIRLDIKPPLVFYWIEITTFFIPVTILFFVSPIFPPKWCRPSRQKIILKSFNHFRVLDSCRKNSHKGDCSVKGKNPSAGNLWVQGPENMEGQWNNSKSRKADFTASAISGLALSWSRMIWPCLSGLLFWIVWWTQG